MRLYVSRHAETDWNADKRTQGVNDIELNARGHSQAKALAKKMAEIRPDYIYSSPLKRAYDSVKPGAVALQRAVFSDNDLTEYNFGVWEGKTLEEIGRLYPQQLADYNKDPLRTQIEGAESFRALKNRCQRFLERMVLHHKGDTVWAMTHSLIAKLMLTGVLLLPDSQARHIRLDNASLTLITFDGNVIEVEYMNQTDHLKGI